jgi:hypothetical protein
MSAPAQKALRPAPRSTIARTVRSASARATHAGRLRHISSDMALRRASLSIVSCAMPSRTS